MIAVIMAGGKASRLGRGREKALLELGGQTLLARAAKTLRMSDVDDIMVAVTRSSPKTRELASILGLHVLETDAGDYHSDTLQLIDRYGSFLSLNVDVPFVRSDHIAKLIAAPGNGSVSAVIPASIAMRKPDDDSLGVDDEGLSVVWVGMNRVTSDPKNVYLTFDDPLLSVNINSDEDLEFAGATMKSLHLD